MKESFKETISQWSAYLPGAAFIALGLLIIFFPMLLVALVSAFLILIGIGAISVAHRKRRWQQDLEWTAYWSPFEGQVGDWLERVFVHRWW